MRWFWQRMRRQNVSSTEMAPVCSGLRRARELEGQWRVIRVEHTTYIEVVLESLNRDQEVRVLLQFCNLRHLMSRLVLHLGQDDVVTIESTDVPQIYKGSIATRDSREEFMLIQAPFQIA